MTHSFERNPSKINSLRIISTVCHNKTRKIEPWLVEWGRATRKLVNLKDVYILQAPSGQRHRPGGQGGRVPDLVCDHPGGGGRGREEGGAAVRHAGPHTLHWHLHWVMGAPSQCKVEPGEAAGINWPLPYNYVHMLQQVEIKCCSEDGCNDEESTLQNNSQPPSSTPSHVPILLLFAIMNIVYHQLWIKFSYLIWISQISKR